MLRRLVLALLLLSAAPARAGEMEVVPVLVNLTRNEKSAVVTIRNRSPEPARYQVSLLAWSQAPDGEMKLAQTEEVLAFPRTLALAPNEAKIVRIGAVAPFGSGEKSYRLFIEEMPPPPKPDAPSRVQVLSRVGIPIFLEPLVAIEKTVVIGPDLDGRTVSFAVRNAGTVHVRPSAVSVSFLDGDGQPIGAKALDAWYVLAYGERRFAVATPPEICAKVRAVRVEVTLTSGILRAKVDAPRGACAP